MICTSIGGHDYRQILEILQNPYVEMAEIRLDLCTLSDDETEDLFANSDTPLVATCRAASLKGMKNPEAEAERRLAIAIKAGARFADLEVEASAAFSKRFQKLCHDNGTEIIRSYHNFDLTPAAPLLSQAVARCFRYGADIAKIAVECKTEDDTKSVLSLYEAEGIAGEGRLIAFGMGEKGRSSRIECLRRGAPFTYASLSDGDTTAPGQFATEELFGMLYRGRAPYVKSGIRMPSSKSMAQRAIVAAALAEGSSHLRSYTPCGDNEAAVSLAEALGAKVIHDAGTLTIKGIGPISEKLELDRLDVGESGLLCRLAIPLAATLSNCSTIIEGHGTLLRRPLKGAVDTMAAFGVILTNEAPQSGQELHVPLKISGIVIPGTADISGASGSQLVSGLLMALPLCNKPSTVYVNEPKSIPYIYMTLDVLRHFGIQIRSEMEGDAQMLQEQDWSYCTGINFKTNGASTYHAADIDIEGDWSAAANCLVAGAIFGSVQIPGLDSKSLQADINILDILVDAGAVVSVAENGDVCVRKAPLEAFSTNLNHSPDLFPCVSVLAAFCAGESRLAGVGRLYGKESDRAAGIVSMLEQMGVEASIEGDEMIIRGETLASRILNGRLLKGGAYTSHHDHRLVMAIRAASLGADGPMTIDDEECVAKSWPGFSRI